MQQSASDGVPGEPGGPGVPVGGAARCRDRAFRSFRAVVLFVLIGVGVLAGDLALKHFSFADLLASPVTINPVDPTLTIIPQTAPKPVVPHVLGLKLTLNTGAVFGIAAGQRWMFVIISIIAAVLLIGIFLRSEARSRLLHVALALMLAGALGNLYDRICFAAVRDMLMLFPGVTLPFGWRWPGGERLVYPWIFNLADVALLSGVVLVLLRELLRPGGKKAAA